MALKVGELAVELGLDDGKYQSKLRKLPQDSKSVGKQAGEGFADGTESGAEPTGGKLSGLVSKMGPMLVAGVAAVGALAGAALMKGLTGAMEQETAVDKLQAQLGASDEMARDYGKVAGKLYADGFGEGYGDIAEAIKQASQNGLIYEDATQAEIEALTRDLMTVSDVLDQDLGMTSQAVGAMLRNGLAKDANEAFDILTRGVQQGVDKAGDLMETFQEYSTLFRDLGIDAGTATGLLSQGLKAGARDADFVADALKEFAIRGQDASETSKAAFEMIGLNAEEMTRKVASGGPEAAQALDEVLDGLRGMEDPVAKNAAAVGLFGTKAEDLGDALFALDPSTAVQGLGDIAGATEKLGEAYDNPAQKIENFKRRGLQALTDFVGGTVIPMIERFVKSEGFQRFVAGAQQAMDTFIGWVQAAWPTVQATIGTVIEAIVSAAMGLADFWSNTLQPALQTVGDYLATNLGPVVQALGGFFSQVVLPAIQAVAGFIGGTLVPIFATVAKFVLGVVVKALQTLAKFIFGTVIPVVSRIAATFISVATTVGQWVGRIVGFVLGIPGRIAGTISGLWNGLRSGIRSAADWVRDRVTVIVNAVKGIGRRIGDIGSVISRPFTAAFDAVKRLWNNSLGKISFRVPGWVPGVGGKGWSFPTMHTGGVVPGAPGEEQLTLLLAGETVRTREQEKQLQKALRGVGTRALVDLALNHSSQSVVLSGASGGSSSPDGLTIENHQHFHGPVAGRDAERWVGSIIESGTRRGVIRVLSGNR